MKTTGIVRKIDNLGRVVIPKEIRKTMKVKEGMPLEIYVDDQENIVLRKYLPFNEYSGIAREYAESLLKLTGDATVITDREKVLAAAGCRKQIEEGDSISEDLERILDDRDEQLPSSIRNKAVAIVEGFETRQQLYTLIRSEGEILGAVFLISRDGKKAFGDSEKKIIAIAADFLGRQAAI